MQQRVPTWLAVVIILAVLVVVGVAYWLLTPKPSPEVGGKRQRQLSLPNLKSCRAVRQ